MKAFIFAIAVLSVVLVEGQAASAQKKTIVLVRHAEKDPSPTADKADPDLSQEGRERAQRLAEAIKRFKPHEIFATEFKRTQQTAEPTARRRGKQVQIYDAGKPAELIQKIMDPASRTEHYLIVGHSNTVPVLANLLFKKELFRQMMESEHSVYWVIRIRKGVPTEVEVRPF